MEMAVYKLNYFLALNRRNFNFFSTYFDRSLKTLQKQLAYQHCQRSNNRSNYNYIAEEIGIRLADRLDDIKRKFTSVLAIGNHTIYCLENADRERICKRTKLIDSFVQPIINSQQSQDKVGGLCIEQMDEESLEKEGDNSYDAVISNLSLHWINKLPQTFRHIERILKPDGLFIASIFGGDTLYELRTSLQLAEMERKGGMSPHISPMIGISDLGNLMSNAGFNLITIDHDDIIVKYPSMLDLIDDLFFMGESNAASPLIDSKGKVVEGKSSYFGKDVFVAANFIYNETHPSPLARGSGKFSLKEELKSPDS